MNQDDRLISLNAAIEALRYAELGCELEAIESLPSAQQWIPVAEGLPDKYEYVLLTCERNGNFVTSFGCLSPDIDGYVAWWIATFTSSIEGWRVIAWAPRPTPYHSEGEEHG